MAGARGCDRGGTQARSAEIGWPSLLLTLSVLGGVGLGGASVGGWGGISLVLLVMAAAIALTFVWSGVRPERGDSR